MLLFNKIPLKISPFFWLVAFLIGFISTFSLPKTVIAALIILFSVILHELGHALTALFFQQKVRIELAAFGGFTYREGRKLKLREEFLVVLNGPLVGLLLGALAYLVFTHFPPKQPLLHFALEFTMLVNIFWTIVNLVPLLPLDGGHLLSILLESIFGFKGIKMAIVIGLVVGLGCTIFFFLIGAFLIGALFLILTFESFRSFRYYRLLTEKDRDTHLQELIKSAEADLQRGEEESALTKFQEVREKTQKGILFTMATQEMARVYRFEERYQEAYALLAPIRKSLTGENILLFHYLAHQVKDYSAAVKCGEEAYQLSPNAEVAMINALSNAALGRSEAAVGWLECAFRNGASKSKELFHRAEFNPIREEEAFKKLGQELQ